MTPAAGQRSSTNRLGGTVEFSLIHDLCQYSNGRLISHKHDKKRRNVFLSLNLSLRIALSRQPDLIFILDLDPADDREDIDAAQKHLHQLCGLLDQFSSPRSHDSGLTGHMKQGQRSQYPQLRSLVNYLKSSATDPHQQFEVMNGFGDHPELFNFPSKDHCSEAFKMVRSFNVFINELKLSKAQIDDLAGVSLLEPTHSRNLIGSLTSSNTNESPLYDDHDPKLGIDGFANCFRHVGVALKAMFWRLSQCNHLKTRAHDILIRLPAVEEVTSQHNYTFSFPLDLFLSACGSNSDQFQEVRVIRRNDKKYLDQSTICNVIGQALAATSGLNLYVQDRLTNAVQNDFQIPSYKYIHPEYSPIKPSKSLRDLLKDCSFRRKLLPTEFLTIRDIHHRVSDKERRTLATQLLYGLIVCLKYDFTAVTWDSMRVFVLTGADGGTSLGMCPYVSCTKSYDKSIELGLPDPGIFLEKFPSPSEAFTKMAKLLLEIGFGQCLDKFEADAKGNIRTLSTDLLTLAHNIIPDSPEEIAYIDAAESCLNFHRSYWVEINKFMQRSDSAAKRNRANDNNSWEIAETIIYEKIIHKFEQTAPPNPSTTESVSETRISAKSSRGARQGLRPYHANANLIQRNVVTLFDSSKIPSDHIWVAQAEAFFDHLEQFRTSFETFINKTNTRAHKAIRIAILDTGIDTENPSVDFDGTHMKHEWCINFIDDAGNCHDYDGHGTNCASLLRKVAPDAEIYVAKVFNGNEIPLEETHSISKAIHYAVNTWDVDVISMSFGIQDLFLEETDMKKWRKIKSEIEKEIDQARPRLLFAAASNEGKNKSRAFPSTASTVFCIHASDGKGNDAGINPDHESDSNNFMTLGVGIKCLEGEEYVYKMGTSFAAAIAAGMAASIMDLTSKTPNLSKRAKKALKEKRGMQELFRKLAGQDSVRPQPYIAPWKFWKPNYWGSDSRGLECTWAGLDSCFNTFYASSDEEEYVSEGVKKKYDI